MSTRRLELRKVEVTDKNKEKGKSQILGGEGQEIYSKPQFALHGTEEGT